MNHSINTRRCFSLAAAVLVAGLACLSAAQAGPEIPGAPQSKPIALVGGTVHPVSGPEIAGGTVLFDKGRLTAIGKDVVIPADAERIDIAGQHVYPGLFDAHTQLGLVEIASVRGSVDVAETGSINPNSIARQAFNPDSELIPVTRSAGVLTVLTAPSGKLLAGTSSVMQLDGWTIDDMTLRPAAGIEVIWPRTFQAYTWRLDEHEDSVQDADKTLRQLRTALDDARAYLTAKTARAQRGSRPPDHDTRWEALIPVFERKLPLIVHADETRQITGAIALAAEQNMKLIIFGGYDAPECAELLKKYDVPVIVNGVTRLPQRRSDAYDTAFTVPARLQAAGVRYCIAGAGRMGNIRNLPYQAGMAAAHGLPPDEALKAITLYPAEILGVAQRIGSLEAGKDATLIVTSGDPLETPTQVTRAFLQGRAVDLSNRQKRLWEKYQEKYRRLKK
jgi:imidazolonepropionase-like amidohydrolase